MQSKTHEQPSEITRKFQTQLQSVCDTLFAQFPSPNYMMLSYISSEPIFSHFECKTLVRLAKQNVLEYQKVNGNVVNGIDLSEFNAKTTALMYGQDADIDYFYDKIRELVATVNRETWGFVLHDFGEPLKFMEYDEGGFVVSHSDLSHVGLSKYRKLTVVVQLSDEDEYAGGELVIQHYQNPYVIPKKIGTVIVFPSFLLHRIEMVLRGVRHTLVGFVYGPPLK